MAADMEEVLIVDMQHWRDALRTSFNRTVGSKYLLNKKYVPLPVLSTGQTEHARVDLVFNFHGSDHVFGRLYRCSLLLQSVPGFYRQHKTRTYGQESGEEQI